MKQMPTSPLYLLAGLLACAAASAQTAPTARRAAMQPRSSTAAAVRTAPSPGLIVQGGLTADAPCAGATGASSAGASTAIGPKQDDPAGPRPADGRDATTGAASGTPSLAIGPKQDDPVAPKPIGRDVATGMAAGRGAVAIGPKQDDPAPPPPANGLARCSPAAH